jgi:flagellar biosynthesis protein FlhB
MVNYGDIQFVKRMMVSRRSEMSAEWKVMFAIYIASVAIQAFTKLLFSFSDVLKVTNCTFQEVDNIFRLAVYDEFFSCICAAEFVCALDVFARHTSFRITGE